MIVALYFEMGNPSRKSTGGRSKCGEELVAESEIILGPVCVFMVSAQLVVLGAYFAASKWPKTGMPMYRHSGLSDFSSFEFAWR